MVKPLSHNRSRRLKAKACQSAVAGSSLFALRRGTSALEVIATCVLLSIAAVMVSTASVRMSRSYASVALLSSAHRELTNAREDIGSWSSDAITEQAIVARAVASDLAERLGDPIWVARVDEEAEPLVAKRVWLQLCWTRDGQSHATDPLVFWVSEFDNE